jgi:hypothetical protein
MLVSSSDFEPGTDDDLYYWSESETIWKNWKAASFDFEQGNGYLVAYQTTQTNSFTGTLTTEDVTYSDLSRDNDGWHLLGNPYSSAIEWNNNDDWYFSHIGETPSVWDEENGTYHNPAKGDPIPATNGFFVQVEAGYGGNDTITIPASARVHNSTNNYKSHQGVQPYTLKLKVTTTSNDYSNQIRIAFNEEATEQWDLKYDCHKMYGLAAAPELWTISNDEEFSVNTLPFTTEPVDLPLNFKAGVDGKYTIHFDGIDSFDGSSIILEDLFTGETIDMGQQTEYTFTASQEDDHGRFVIHFFNVTSTPEIGKEDNPVLIYAYNNNIIIKSLETSLNGKVEVLNILGQILNGIDVRNVGFYKMHADYEPGVYLVRYTGKNGYEQTQKVILE